MANPARKTNPAWRSAATETRQTNPAGRGRIAAASVPALAFALLILLAARLSAAFAGPVAGPTGQPPIPPDGRSGLAAARVSSDGSGRFESADRGSGSGLGGRRVHATPSGPVA